MTTARDITKALRGLFPHVTMSTRATNCSDLFLVKLPITSAYNMQGRVPGTWPGFDVIARKLGVRVEVCNTRVFTRRDCGRSMEILIRVGRPLDVGSVWDLRPNARVDQLRPVVTPHIGHRILVEQPGPGYVPVEGCVVASCLDCGAEPGARYFLGPVLTSVLTGRG